MTLVVAMLAAATTNALFAAPQLPSRPAPARESEPPTVFHAAAIAPQTRIALPAPEKLAPDTSGRYRVGVERAVPKALQASATKWQRVADGYVSRFEIAAEGARGLRAHFELGTLPGTLELRAHGVDGPIEKMTLDPFEAPEAWGPYTDGDVQTIELYSQIEPATDAVRVAAIGHFFASPLEKTSPLSCNVSTKCPTSNPALDQAIAERKKSVMRILFMDGTSYFVCTATLINTSLYPIAHLLTANHCVATETVARSITMLWFYETATCTDLAVAAGSLQVTPTIHLVFTNPTTDATLLRMDTPVPAGAVYAGWDAAAVALRDVVTIGHPRGDTMRYAIGDVVGDQEANTGFQEPLNVVKWRAQQGLVEPGDSGSGLYTFDNGTLTLRGILSLGSTPSCSSTNYGWFNRMYNFYPMIAPYIGDGANVPDDAPNRVADMPAASPFETTLDQSGLATYARQIERGGDVDLFRFTTTRPGAVTASSSGVLDTVGAILDFEGRKIAANDDAQRDGDLNFGFTKTLQPGTYHLLAQAWSPKDTGAYTAQLRWDAVDPVYTDLWWNEQESGWGINVNHQGNIVFATLFTYDLDGSQMWLVMSNGARQSDGSFVGPLYRTTGPVFSASPWGAVNLSTVGTMRLAFPTTEAGSLTYDVNGITVKKNITRQRFSTPPTCDWSRFDRSQARNFQDLWWNPAEPGWGINLTHQSKIVFATLFTYEANGRGQWLVMSNGQLQSDGSYYGTLYRTIGPAFNAAPWPGITLTEVGVMTLAFTDGNNASLIYTLDGVRVSKQIQRQVFSDLRVECAALPPT